MMYATLAGSLNVINGYSGQTCLGQAGFFAIGAYACAALTKNVGIDFWIVLPIAGILAACLLYTSACHPVIPETDREAVM